MANNKVVVKFLADTDQMKKSLQSIDTGLKRFGKAALGIGAAVATAFAVDKLVDFGKQSLTLAGELEQLQGASEQLFGSGASQIQDWAKGASDALGLSEAAYLQAANSLSIFGKIQGQTGDELTRWTNEQITLAADLAAMYGGTTTDAVNALTAAQKGNFEQMDRYGIPITATMVEKLGQEELGIKGAYAEWDNATKSRVIEEYVRQSESATAASGQFAREADTLQGVLQRLQANLENIGVEFGNALLPVVTAFADQLLPVVKELAPIMGELGKNIAEALAPAFEAIGKVLPSIVQLLATMAGNVGGLLTVAIQTLTPILTSVIETLSELAQRTAPLAQRLLEALARVFSALWKAVEPVLDVLLELSLTLVEALLPFLEILADILVEVIDALVPLIRAIAGVSKALLPLNTALLNLIVVALKPLIPLLTIVIEFMAVGLTKAIIFVAKALGTQLVAWGKWASNTSRIVGPTIEKLLGWAASLAEGFAFLPIVGDDFQGVASSIRGAGASITNALGNIGASAIGAGKQLQGLEAEVYNFNASASEVNYYDSLLSIPNDTMKKAKDSGETLGRETSKGAAKGVEKGNPEFQKKIKDALDKAQDLFSTWREKVVGFMDLGKAFTEANDAKARLSSLNEQLAELRLTPEYDKTREAELLAEIDEAGRDAGKTWSERFAEQIAEGTDFARQLGDLKKSGLNDYLLQQIADMGPQQGSVLATELLTGDQGFIDKLNSQTKEMYSAGETLGLEMANAAAPAGKKWALTFINDPDKGLVATIQANSKKVKKKIKQALDSEVSVRVVYTADYTNAGPAYNSGRARSSIEARSVITDIQNYERLNGSKWRQRVR